MLFEVVRELLFNVVKHAGVAEATVRVASDFVSKSDAVQRIRAIRR